MRRYLILILLVGVIFMSYSSKAAYVQSGYSKCVAFTNISNPKSFPLVGYQANVTINTTRLIVDGMNETGRDFRIIQNGQFVPFYNFTTFNTSITNIMFKVNISEFANITSVQVCYGNTTDNYANYQLKDVYEAYDEFNYTDAFNYTDTDGLTNNNLWYNMGIGAWNSRNSNLSGSTSFSDSTCKADGTCANILCLKNNNISSFVADYYEVGSGQGYTIQGRLLFYFNNTGNNNELSNNGYQIRQSSVSSVAIGNTTNYTGLTFQENYLFSSNLTNQVGNKLMRKRYEILKGSYNNFTFNASIQYPTGEWNSTLKSGASGEGLYTETSNFSRSGTVCIANEGATQGNISNFTLYQKIDPDLTYSINESDSKIPRIANPNLTINNPSLTSSTSNVSINLSMASNTAFGNIDSCYFNVTYSDLVIIAQTKIANCATNDTAVINVSNGNAIYKFNFFVNDSFNQVNSSESRLVNINVQNGQIFNPERGGSGGVFTNIIYNGSFSLEQKTIDKYVIYTDFDGNEQASTIALLTGNRILNKCSTTGAFKCGQLDQNKVPLLLSYQTKGLHLKTLLEDLLGKNIKGTVTVNADTGEVITKEVNVKVIDITLGIQIGDFNVRLIWLVIGGAAFYLFNLLRSPSRVRIKVTR